MVAKLMGGSILLRDSSTLTGPNYTGANDKPNNPGQGNAYGRDNGKSNDHTDQGKHLGQEKNADKGKRNTNDKGNGKGNGKFEEGSFPGQGLEHRSDRANEVAQNVYKNPNLKYLLSDPNSPYYQGGDGSTTVDPNAPVQNADGTLNNDQIVVIGPTSERVYYYHPDHLGSTAVVTNEDGTLHEQVEYFPFGETWVQNGGNDKVTPYLFTSKELDSETGLYYFGARYYDPRTSVWQSPDPILEKYLPTGDKKKDQNLPGMGGVYSTMNLGLYIYAGLNPVRLIDPTGNEKDVPRFFVLHTTEGPVNNPVSGKVGAANMYVGQDGRMMQAQPVGDPRGYATKLEIANPEIRGQLYNVEVINDKGGAFTDKQYNALAALFVSVSDPANNQYPTISTHKEIDRGLPGGHHDPSNINLNKLYEKIKDLTGGTSVPGSGHIKQEQHDIQTYPEQNNFYPPLNSGGVIYE